MSLPPYNEKLHKEFQRRGGIFEESYNDTEIGRFILAIQQYYEGEATIAQNRFYNIRPRPLYFNIVLNTKLSAFAWSTSPEDTPQFDFIGFHIGTIVTLHLIFNEMLCHPSIFPTIGDIALEKEERVDLPYLTPNIIFAGFKAKSPVDPVRKEFAQLLLFTALDFLFWHELCHLRHGHTDFVQKECGDALIAEAVGENSIQIDPLTMQTLEMDADSYGLLLALQLNIATPAKAKFISEKNTLTAIKCFSETPLKFVDNIWFAIYTLFRIWGDIEWNPSNPDIGHHAHPPLPMRQYHIGALIYEILEKKPGLLKVSPHDYAKNSAGVMENVEIAISLITKQRVDPKGIISVAAAGRTTLTNEYLDSLARRWTEIRPELEKYKRGGNLPP